jgi:hypothetical protein
MDSSDESEISDDGLEEQRESSKRGLFVQVSPLDVRFSQKKMRHMFMNGNLLADVAPLVQTVRCSKEEEASLGTPWRLVAPFPAIEVVRWRCKLRDERTGRPKVDPESGACLFDSEEHLFTLDNRRLYCLQLAGTRVWPEACSVQVSELPAGPPELMREMKKFKTMDCGKSILIGSRQDKVPFVRWAWRAKLKIADPASAPTGGGKGAAKAKAKGRAARNREHGVVTNQGVPAGEAPDAGSLLLRMVKEGNTPLAKDEGAAQGALLLGLLKGPAPTPVKAAAPLAPAADQNWVNSSWWESGYWQGACEAAPAGRAKGRKWVKSSKQ